MRLASCLIVLGCLAGNAVPAVAQQSAPEDGPESLAEQLPDGVAEARELFVGALKAKGTERVNQLRQSFGKLEEAASSNPDLAPARTMWARFLLAANDHESARVALQAATVEHADDPEAYALLANLAIVSGQAAEAQLTYHEASRLVDLWPEDHGRRQAMRALIASGLAAVANTRGSFAAQHGKVELAKEYEQVALARLQEWVAISSQSSAAHERLAEALLKSGDVESATTSLERARSLNPALPLTDLRLARAYLAKGDHDAARDRLRQAVADHPKDLQVRLAAGEMYLTVGDTGAAGEQIDAALELDGQSVAAKLLSAQLRRFLGDWTGAAELLQDANTSRPSDFETANLLALTLSEVDRDDAKQRAVELATVTAQRFKDLKTPTGRRAGITLTWTAFAAGQKQAAEKGLNKLLQIGIQSRQISGDEAFYVAQLFVDFGRPELASPLLTAVLARGASFPKRAAAAALLQTL